MGNALVNPLVIPGAQNPAGSQVSMPAPFSGGTTASGGSTNPYMNPVSTSTTASPTNPYAGSFGAYGFPGNTSAPSPVGVGTTPNAPNIIGTGTGSGNLTGGQNKALESQLDKTYGKGMGALLLQFMNSGAGYNPQVLQQLFSQLQPQFANQQQNLLQQFSASGNRFGSGAQTGFADLLGQQSETEGSIAANLYEQSIQNYMQILEGTSGADASRIAQTPSTFDDIASFISAAKPNVVPIPGM